MTVTQRWTEYEFFPFILGFPYNASLLPARIKRYSPHISLITHCLSSLTSATNANFSPSTVESLPLHHTLPTGSII
jgi:hypothetical protein